jgi:hypothetical protein
MPQVHVCYYISLALHTLKMMHSIILDDEVDTDTDWDIIAKPDQDARAPSSSSDDYHGASDSTPRASTYDDDVSDVEPEEHSGRKKGGYDSRVEQILYEDPNLPILITEAGKSQEGGGKYIVYTIRTGVNGPQNYSSLVCADSEAEFRGQEKVLGIFVSSRSTCKTSSDIDNTTHP